MASTGQPARWMHDMLQEGFALLAANRLNDASECCRRLLQAKPDLVEAHFLVGLIALELKQTWAAVSAFGSVTKLKPDHGAAWAHMAKLFMAAGQPNRADLALENAIRHEDGNPVVHDLIGTVHAMLGEQQEALHWYGKAVGKEPRQVAFLVNHANSQMYLGNLREAEEELHNVLALQPANPNAHWLLSGVRKAVNRDHADQLYELAAKAGISPRASAFLNYALGKELEDLEQWDQAFEAFARGAAARRQTVEFDACRPGFRHRAVPSSTSRTGTIRPGAWSRTGGRTTPRSCSAVSPPATNPAASAASTSSPASRARFTVDTSPTRPSTDRRISVPRR
jgi:predicted Zn-dependent protease